MKSCKLLLAGMFAGLILLVSCEKENTANTETKTIDFEDLTVGAAGFWNGSDGSGAFISSGMTFTNEYDNQYGSWSGFSYSQKADVTTTWPDNMYSVFNTLNGSNKFVIYYPPYGADAYAGFPAGTERVMNSISVCNSTYAALSVKDGDSFAKKFGGASGNDPDWFKMTIIGYNAEGDSVRAVDFYLADYRFGNNVNDYIIDKRNLWNEYTRHRLP